MTKILTEEQLEEMRSIKWWHRIPIGQDLEGNRVFTPGTCKHGPDKSDYATSRFGLPTDMRDCTVADIGGWDGYFAFEAEKRGAKGVTVFDVGQEEGGNWGTSKGFVFAKKVLDSHVQYVNASIYDLSRANGFTPYDVTLFFGVLYHLKAPLIALERLFEMTKENGYSLIETAISQESWGSTHAAAWLFMPGYDNDPTNYFYPTITALIAALYFVGYKDVQILFSGEKRCTVKAIK
jgi:tRNA (mo5U34)-methyltransferase